MQATEAQRKIIADIRVLDALIARLHVHPRQRALGAEPSKLGRALRLVLNLREVRARYLEDLGRFGMADGYYFESLWTGAIGGFNGYGDHTLQTLYGPPTKLSRKPQIGHPSGEPGARVMAWAHALPDLRELERREWVRAYYEEFNAD